MTKQSTGVFLDTMTDRAMADEMEQVNDRLRARIVELEATIRTRDTRIEELAARIEALHRALTDLLFWSTPGEERGCTCDRCRAIRKARAVAVER